MQVTPSQLRFGRKLWHFLNGYGSAYTRRTGKPMPIAQMRRLVRLRAWANRRYERLEKQWQRERRGHLYNHEKPERASRAGMDYRPSLNDRDSWW
jgi:hypothetical protein